MGYKGYQTFKEVTKEFINILIDSYHNPDKYDPDSDHNWVCIAGSNAVDGEYTFHINDILCNMFTEHLKNDEFYQKFRETEREKRKAKEEAEKKRIPPSHYEWEFHYGFEWHPDKPLFKFKETFTPFDGWSYWVRVDDFPKFINFIVDEFVSDKDKDQITKV